MDEQSPRKPSRPLFEGVSEGRSRNMQANRGKDTKPEMEVRRLLHALGYRYRLHRRDLPGKPDLVFPARRRVIEVRGCFWHGHGCHPLGQLPKSRTDYWAPKIARNKERDVRNIAALRDQGWDVLEVWECRIRTAREAVVMELVEFLGPVNARSERLGVEGKPDRGPK
ncbi:very short patch repair endonuclease [Xanthobacter autotrophicus]|uniref:very short patch repair endonuclease n=1 Tax=Xanthobacter autotrophicus TaxID=280 RepID=UPI00372743C2